jgi:hypothetical protein
MLKLGEKKKTMMTEAEKNKKFSSLKSMFINDVLIAGSSLQCNEFSNSATALAILRINFF